MADSQMELLLRWHGINFERTPVGTLFATDDNEVTAMYSGRHSGQSSSAGPTHCTGGAGARSRLFPPVSRVPALPIPRSPTLAAALLFAGPLSLLAQDTRQVVEPHVPPACTVLRARLAAGDERRLDTERIQQAMDHCGRGKAVVLRAQGRDQTFLSGPLILRSGMTLVVDANTSLAASRDPRVYDLFPGSCGVVNKRGHGCKPLIAGDNVTDSGIMGAGSIDGRGRKNRRQATLPISCRASPRHA